MIARMWDWIDERDIDKHAVSLAILFGTVRIEQWAMAFASAHPNVQDGIGVAAIIGAVTAPYMALQGAAIKFYFEARK